jgi:hypothetical protein
MNTFILVVLQATAAISTNSSYSGWSAVGEFASEKACIAASVRLAQASQDARGIKNFQCLSKT